MPESNDSQSNKRESVSRESPSEVRERRISFRAEQSVTYNSPIVPPEILAEYGKVIPDAPERILAMVERQEAHRHHIEKTVVEAGVKNASKAINVTAYIATLFGIYEE